MLHSPWVDMYSHCHQLITQAWPQDPHELLDITQKTQSLNRPMLA